MNNDDGKSWFGLGIDNTQLQADANRSIRIFNSIGDKAEAEGTRIDNSFMNIAKSAVALFSIDKMKEFGNEIINVRSQIESFEISFETLLGNKEKASAMFGELREFAATTPLGLMNLGKGAEMMLGFNVEAEKVVPTLKQIGDISMGNVDRFNSLTLAFSQMHSTGKLMGQDLLQMINAGFNPLSQISKTTGKSVSELKEEMSDGAISAEMVAKAFEDAAGKGGMFNGMLEKQAKGMRGAKAAFESTVDDMFNHFGEKNQEMITGGFEFSTSLVRNYDAIGTALVSLIAIVGLHKAALIAENAWYKASAKSKYIATTMAEGEALRSLETVETKAILTKQGLKQGTVEYYAALKVEVLEKQKSLQATAALAQADLVSAQAASKAATQRALASRQLVRQREREFIVAKQTQGVEQYELAQKNLLIAQEERHAAIKAKKIVSAELANAAARKEAAANALASTTTTIDTAATAGNTAAKTLNIRITKALSVAAARLNAILAANIWTIVAIGVAAVVYGLYKFVTAASAAERAQKRFNEAQEKFSEQQDEIRSKVETNIRIIQDETETLIAHTKAYEELQKQCKKLTDAYSLEELKTIELSDARKILNQSRDDSEYEHIISNIDKAKKSIERLEEQWDMIAKQPNSGGALVNLGRKLDDAKEDLKQWENALKEAERLKKEAEKNATPVEVKLIEAKTDLVQIQREFDIAKKKLEEEQKKLKNNKWGVIPISIELEYRFQQNRLKDTQGDISELELQIEASKKETVGDRKIRQTKELTAAEKKLGEMKKANSVSSEKEIEEQQKAVDKLKKSLGLDNSSVSAAGKAKKEREEAAKKQAEYKELQRRQSEEEARAIVDAENAVEQARINTMEESSEKILAQLKLNHKKELEELEREKADYLQRKIDNAKTLYEANPANKGKTFDGSNVQLSEQENNFYSSRKTHVDQKHSNEDKKLIEEQRRTMNEYLAEYGEYMKKRQAIIDLYNEKMNKSLTEGEKLKLGEEMKKALAEADDEAKKKTSIITRLFSDMSKKTVADMRYIADNAQKMLDYIDGGEFKVDQSGNGLFGLTKEQYDILAKSPEKLQSIKDEIANVRKEADKAEPAMNKMANGLKKVFSTTDTKKLEEGIGEIESGMNDVMKVGQFLSNSLSNLGDAFGSEALLNAAEGIDVAMDAASSAMEGAQAGAMFGPWGAAAGAVIGLVSSLSSSLARLHDAKHEKKIQEMQEQIEVLEKSYEKLSGSIDKAFSKDASNLIAQQNELLKQQKILIQNQINEEKGKKKSDDGRIKEWEQQLADIDDLIAENEEKAVSAIFGEDIKAAIENFADAYVDAWAAGDDKAKSSKDLVKKMIKQMVLEAMKADISKPMEAIRAKLLDFWADGYISANEQSIIDSMVQNLSDSLDSKYGWADDYMLDGASSSQDSTKRGFETMSQDSADELNGRFTALQLNSELMKGYMLTITDDVKAIRFSITSSRESIDEMKNLSLLSIGYLETISKNTHELFAMNDRLEKIEKNTRKL